MWRQTWDKELTVVDVAEGAQTLTARKTGTSDFVTLAVFLASHNFSSVLTGWTNFNCYCTDAKYFFHSFAAFANSTSLSLAAAAGAINTALTGIYRLIISENGSIADFFRFLGLKTTKRITTSPKASEFKHISRWCLTFDKKNRFAVSHQVASPRWKVDEHRGSEDETMLKYAKNSTNWFSILKTWVIKQWPHSGLAQYITKNIISEIYKEQQMLDR